MYLCEGYLDEQKVFHDVRFIRPKWRMCIVYHTKNFTCLNFLSLPSYL